MRHAKVQNRLSAYLERDLETRERVKIARHLADCADCAARLRELEATVLVLRRLPEPAAPAALAERVMARVRAGEAEPAGWLDWLRRAAQPAMALPIAALVIGLALFAGDLERGGAAPTPSLQAAAFTDPPVRFVALERHPDRVGVRADRLDRLALQRPDEVVRFLTGAGHPHSHSLASHLEEPEVAFVGFTPRRLRR